jgi:hypothetical protein
MGLFDVYCQVSGISSYGHDLEGTLFVDNGSLLPLCPLVRGASNRVGGIDMIKDNELLMCSFDAIQRWIDIEDIVLDVHYDDLKSLEAYRAKHAGPWTNGEKGIHGFEWIFQVLSHGTWDGFVSLRHETRPVRACLAVPQMVDAAVETVAHDDNPVWAALREGALEKAGIGVLLDLAFDAGTEVRYRYERIGESPGDKRPLRRALLRLARLRAFLREHGGPRAPTTTQSDNDPAAAEACFERFAGYPAFRKALNTLYPKRFGERFIALEKLAAGKARGGARPYDPNARYQEGDLVAHAKFGEGVAAGGSKDGKVEIIFASGSKKLVCAR